ncbi:hypothetical protein WISP_33932 [Willisornis vidua]|uniref:Uncharacterized protein n=1 Tax=Willisornis vidua TaxID=1566151 RepID=A0ABQ9DM61_9PASS|nr:hypothetical protein WISP_33932 [Willisornis vidua]
MEKDLVGLLGQPLGSIQMEKDLVGFLGKLPGSIQAGDEQMEQDLEELVGQRLDMALGWCPGWAEKLWLLHPLECPRMVWSNLRYQMVSLPMARSGSLGTESFKSLVPFLYISDVTELYNLISALGNPTDISGIAEDGEDS